MSVHSEKIHEWSRLHTKVHTSLLMRNIFNGLNCGTQTVWFCRSREYVFVVMSPSQNCTAYTKRYLVAKFEDCGGVEITTSADETSI